MLTIDESTKVSWIKGAVILFLIIVQEFGIGDIIDIALAFCDDIHAMIIRTGRHGIVMLESFLCLIECQIIFYHVFVVSCGIHLNNAIVVLHFILQYLSRFLR